MGADAVKSPAVVLFSVSSISFSTTVSNTKLSFFKNPVYFSALNPMIWRFLSTLFLPKPSVRGVKLKFLACSMCKELTRFHLRRLFKLFLNMTSLGTRSF